MAIVRRRAASEILGAIIVVVITMAMSVAYTSYGLIQAQTQTASISDVLRSSAKAQRQLLSLTYYYADGQGKLHAYIYNMGGEESTLKKIVVGSQVCDLSDQNTQNVQLRDAENKDLINDFKIDPKKLAELIIELSEPVSDTQVDLLVLTEEGGIFIWRLNP